jgi:hypothetical protein
VSTLLQDHFTDADNTNLTAHAMDVGPGWTAQAGTFTVIGNVAHCTVANSEYVADAGQADVTLTCTINMGSGASEAAVIFREQDSNNFWAVSAYAGDGNFYLYHKVSGSLGAVTSGTGGVISGTPFVLSVVLSGSSFIIKKDGVTVINWTDATFQTATKFGLRLWSGTASTWDDFSVVSSAAASGLLEKRRKALAV